MQRRPSSAPAANSSVRSIQYLRRRRRQRSILRGEDKAKSITPSFAKESKNDNKEANEYLRREVEPVISEAVSFALAENSSLLNTRQSFQTSFSKSSKGTHCSEGSIANLGTNNSSDSHEQTTLGAIKSSASMAPLCAALMESALTARPKDVASFFESLMEKPTNLARSPPILPDHAAAKRIANVHAQKDCTLRKIINSTSKGFSPVSRTASNTSKLRQINILVIGLDGAGKSTMVSTVKGKTNPKCKPSLGFCPTTMMYGSSTKTTFYDIGGGDRIRGIWSSYYHDVHGVIYVIDASTMNEKKYEKSLKVAKEELGHNYLEGKPLLVFCNKFDEPSAACRQIEHIQHDMNLIIREGGRVMIKGVSLHPKNQDGEVDPTIDDSLEWLITTVLSDWDNLRERVSLEMKENDEKQRRMEMEKERRLFKQSICKAFGLQGESQAEVLDRESGNEYLAQEIGLEHGSDLPTIGLNVAKLVGYHKFALMMVGGMIAPARKTKHHWSWEEVADFVRATRSELGLTT